MEARKDVGPIIKAAFKLSNEGEIAGLYCVLCSNKNDEAGVYLADINGSDAAEHVTFAGYRNDIPELMCSSYVGVIGFVGWDSVTHSSIEMLASGLPQVNSNLSDLAEVTVHDGTGFLFKPCEYSELAWCLYNLTRDSIQRQFFAENTPKRAVSFFGQSNQISLISPTHKEY